MAIPVQFRLSVNFKSFPWQDVEMDVDSFESIAQMYYPATNFREMVNACPEAKALFYKQILEILRRDGREYELDPMINSAWVESTTDNITHVKCKVRVTYGSRLNATDNYLLKLESWDYVPGSSTYDPDYSCVEDYLFELRFMER